MKKIEKRTTVGNIHENDSYFQIHIEEIRLAVNELIDLQGEVDLEAGIKEVHRRMGIADDPHSIPTPEQVASAKSIIAGVDFGKPLSFVMELDKKGKLAASSEQTPLQEMYEQSVKEAKQDARLQLEILTGNKDFIKAVAATYMAATGVDIKSVSTINYYRGIIDKCMRAITQTMKDQEDREAADEFMVRAGPVMGMENNLSNQRSQAPVIKCDGPEDNVEIH